MVVFPPRSMATLAERIEIAYLRRSPKLHREYAHSGVWQAAAAVLAEMHRADPSLPLDPELYVASQEPPAEDADPWRELTRPASAQRYRRRVRKIVRQLRDELIAEIRGAERRLRQGQPLAEVLTSPDPSLSSLGRYLVAHRRSRPDLADLFAIMARDQHRACPLYRQACDGLIPPGAYPVFDLLPEWVEADPTFVPVDSAPYSLN